MATRQTRTLARIMSAPSIIVLFVWMIVPLALTLWYSFQRFNLQHPDRAGFVWFRNYYFFLTDPAFIRPAEVDVLQADPSLARRELQWEPTVSLKALIGMMVDADLERLKK